MSKYLTQLKIFQEDKEEHKIQKFNIYAYSLNYWGKKFIGKQKEKIFQTLNIYIIIVQIAEQ